MTILPSFLATEYPNNNDSGLRVTYDRTDVSDTIGIPLWYFVYFRCLVALQQRYFCVERAMSRTPFTTTILLARPLSMQGSGT